MRALLLIVPLLAAACGGAGGGDDSPDAGGSPDAARFDAPPPSPDAGSPDATPPDAPPPTDGGSVTVVDWSQNRGEALAQRTITLPASDLSAVSSNGFVVGGDCGEAGCRYEWFDLEGRSQRVLEKSRPVHSSIISPDGSKLLLLEQESIGPCGTAEQRPTVASGTLRLLDAATGDTLWSRVLRSNIWSNPSFSTSGRWFGVGAIPDGACGVEEVPHSVTSHEPHPTPNFFPVAELPRDRFIGWRGASYGVGGSDGSFTVLGQDVDVFGFGGGWAYSADGYSYAVEKLTAFAEDGRMFVRDFDPDAAWRLRHTWGRYAVLCRDTNTPSPETCSLVDITAELPTRTLIIDPRTRYDIAVLDRGASIAYIAPSGALERFDVAAAHTEHVAEGPGTLHRLGDGGAVLWLAGGDVTLVEAGRHEPLLSGDVSAVIALPGALNEGRETAQARTALIVQTFGVEQHRLWLFDYPSRRLVRLSDRLYYAPHVGSPYGFDDCGVPRPMRLGGHQGDLLRQDARYAFFLEQPQGGATEHTIFVVPLDLTAPPRKLATTMPVYCRSPMSSPDGSVVLVDIDGFDGKTTAITLARP